VKKSYILLKRASLAWLMALVLGLAGCSSNAPQAAAPSPTASAKGPITWAESTTVSMSDNPAWGRMLVKDKQGDTLITYTEYPAVGTPTIKVARRNADGSSWTEIASISTPDDNGGYWQEQSQLAQLADGTILMAARNRQADLNWFGLPIMKSTDGGHTWTTVSQLDTNPNANGRFNRGLWEPFLYVLPNGCAAGFYANEKHAEDNPSYSQIVSERVSCDEGKTWGAEIYAASQPGEARPGMPGFARMANGEYILVFEVCGTDACNIHFKISNDGTTWAKDDLGMGIENQQAGPFVTVLSTGRILVMSANTNLISFSDDNGKTWYLQDPPPWDTLSTGTWPAIYQTGKNEISVISNFDGTLQMKFGHF
jgi:hypothetical protein